ncbi:ABC transporter ATP-binding protein/permease [Saccharophagus sp. K07]|uniref:ABCB family ABC transporter ATP-binding protein/permease n=1 Tax=Saccharophagus sp. K07 TaxID=2283636 RepID=UPI00351C6E5F
MRPSHHVPSDSDIQPNWRVILLLAPYLMEFKGRVLLSLLLLIAAKVAGVAVPWVLKLIVDDLDLASTAAIVVPAFLLLAYGALRFASVFLGELRDAVFARVTERAMRRVGLKVFSHLHSLDLDFHLSRKTGGLSRDIERGTSGINFLLRFLLFNIIPTIFELLLVALVLFKQFSFTFSVAVIISIAIYIVFSVVITEWRTKFVREANEQDNRSNTRAIDSLLNYETVKYFNNEQYESREYDQHLQAWEQSRLKNRLSLAALNSGQALIIAASVTVMMFMAAQGVVAEEMTLGDFVMINAYMIQLFIPLNFLGFVYREIRQSLINVERMFELLRVEPKIRDLPTARPFITSDGRSVSVEFRSVSFAYDPARPILRNVSFTAAPGQKIAIVGPSGAGKSTIAKLLFRFYDPNEGEIYLGGHNIRELSLDSLRAQFGVVPQDTVLFNDTIFYNIAYGNPNASREEVLRAAEAAHLKQFIERLPKGYETQVGERGLKVSGGEKQRIAIARVLLKNPSVLIFDEATSALDTETERVITQALDELAVKHTVLIIAHRLSTVMNADRILVLHEGEIVEQGTHIELLARKGVYSVLWQNQLHQESQE